MLLLRPSSAQAPLSPLHRHLEFPQPNAWPTPSQELLELREGLVDAMQGLVDDNGWFAIGGSLKSAEPTDRSSVDLEELERIHKEVPHHSSIFRVRMGLPLDNALLPLRYTV